MSAKQELRIKGKTVRVSNLDKVFYPKCGFTKGDVIDYYIQISPTLLPYIKNRPLSLKRYPDGVEGEFFYEKQRPAHAPEWIKTTPVARSDGSIIDYCMLNDLPSLVWAANIANLELHPFQHKKSQIEKPTTLVFDLDPGAPADIIDCCQVAIWIRDIFKALKLECFAKTSGSKGMQLAVPLNTPGTSYETTKLLAHTIAEVLAARFPDKVVSDMKKSLRKDRVLIDWSQNDDGKTTVAPYSLRARELPTVSTPVTWDEVAKALKKGKAELLKFQTKDVLKRVERDGDIYEPVLKLKQRLPPKAVIESLAAS